MREVMKDSSTWVIALFVGLLMYGSFLTWENVKARSAAELGLSQAQQTMQTVIDSQRESEERVQELNDRVTELTEQVAESEAAIRALRRQIIRLGETPVVNREGQEVGRLQTEDNGEAQDTETTNDPPGQSDPQGEAKGHDKDNEGQGQGS